MSGRLCRTLCDVGIGTGLTALAIAVLALGVGLNTILFAVGLAAGVLGTFSPPPRPSDP